MKTHHKNKKKSRCRTVLYFFVNCGIIFGIPVVLLLLFCHRNESTQLTSTQEIFSSTSFNSQLNTTRTITSTISITLTSHSKSLISNIDKINDKSSSTNSPETTLTTTPEITLTTTLESTITTRPETTLTTKPETTLTTTAETTLTTTLESTLTSTLGTTLTTTPETTLTTTLETTLTTTAETNSTTTKETTLTTTAETTFTTTTETALTTTPETTSTTQKTTLTITLETTTTTPEIIFTTILTTTLATTITLSTLTTLTTYSTTVISATSVPRTVIFQRRINGLFDFNQTYAVYENGFGNEAGEFWKGLKWLNSFTSTYPCKLLINMTTSLDFVYYALYDNFYVGPSSDGYRINVSGFSGTAGDQLIFHNLCKFSARDRDQDNTTTFNCAKSYDSGWWFASCFVCNLNGVYMPPTYSGTLGIKWNTLSTRSHKNSLMTVIVK